MWRIIACSNEIQHRQKHSGRSQIIVERINTLVPRLASYQPSVSKKVGFLIPG